MSEYPTYLIHYGIEGQKWGVRRFQNEDGTYTSEGLERRKDGLSEKKVNKLIKSYNKNPNKFGKEVRKLKSVKDFKKNNQYEKQYSSLRRKKWVLDEETNTKAIDKGEEARQKLYKNNSDFFIGKAKKIYSEEEINKEYEKAINKYLSSDEVNKKYSEIERDLNNTYNSYIKSGEEFTNKILGKYSNIKINDTDTLSKKFAEEINKNKRGKQYKTPSQLSKRPNRDSVRQIEEYRQFKKEHNL